VRGNQMQGIAAPAVDISERGLTDADGFLKHRLKHGLKITGGTADDLEHLRGCRLLLQRLVQLAGEPRDLCPLASMN
jgi:hypothetical protein